MTKPRFTDQVAIVTGAASGIGAAVARRLATEGARVALLDRDQATLDALLPEWRAAGLDPLAIAADIGNEQQVADAVGTVVKRCGRLDIMVNSAGIVGPTNTRITDYRLEDYRRVLDINLVGAFLTTKYAVREMLPKNYGRVLLIASIAGKDGNPGMCGYVSSKSGVIGLVKGVGKEVAESGITVNGLAPAVIVTPMNAKTDPEMLRYMTDKIPMKRPGTVDEVASLSAWICSSEASYNTGCIFDLSGGRAVY